MKKFLLKVEEWFLDRTLDMTEWLVGVTERWALSWLSRGGFWGDAE